MKKSSSNDDFFSVSKRAPRKMIQKFICGPKPRASNRDKLSASPRFILYETLDGIEGMFYKKMIVFLTRGSADH